MSKPFELHFTGIAAYAAVGCVTLSAISGLLKIALFVASLAG